MKPLHPIKWSSLSKPQLGKYAEHLAKMEFILLGCDVFTSEVDDHGIDLVIRTRGGQHYDVQVKSFRSKSGSTPYVYLQKSIFPILPNRLLALIQFTDGEAPALFLIQAEVNGKHNDVFDSYDYEGKQSDPEWGLRLSQKKLDLLNQQCHFHLVARQLLAVD
jgi:hypothetical protein